MVPKIREEAGPDMPNNGCENVVLDDHGGADRGFPGLSLSLFFFFLNFISFYLFIDFLNF